jgi:hypothetical protein
MNVAEERAQAMRGLAEQWRAAGAIDAAGEARIVEAFPQRWRVNSIPLQAVFFVLTAIGIAATYGLVNLLGIPQEGVVIGALAIVTSELLVRRGWFRTGVEAALLIGGLISLITALPSSGEPEALLVIAAAFVIAAIRLRHPLFAVVAVVLVNVWSEVRFDLGLVVALALGTLAAIALSRRVMRPSVEWTLALLTLVMPVAGRAEAEPHWRVVTITLMFGYGAFLLLLAITRRHHALFFASILALAIACVDVAERIQIPIEAKLAIAGGLLLGLAFSTHRALRGRTRGFVLRDRFARDSEGVEIAATLAMQPGAEAPAAPREGGGAFGGAGASGDY